LGTGKEIMGRISASSGAQLTLTTTLGTTFTVNFPVDPLTTFNTQRSQYYQNMTIGLGDTIYVWYTESQGQSSTSIRADQLFRSSLILRDSNLKANPDAALQKY
jgi:hypothetical protein